MSPGPLEGIYFDTLSELTDWHDKLIRETDSGQSRLDEFRRSHEELDAYQIGDPNDDNVNVHSKTLPRRFHSMSSASATCPPSPLSGSPHLRPRIHSTDSGSKRSRRNFLLKYLSGSRTDSDSSDSSHNGDENWELRHNLHRSKLMVCHDFKNGYQQGHDRSTTGYYPHHSGKRYLIQYPQLLDSFIYFSHHRVTVPPVSWINTCHRNCIKCFGTIIFEGSSYSADLDRLVQVGKDGYFVFVEMLADLADRYGFDGYLINIETQFSNTRIAELLISFIESLKAKLHTDNLKNEIIWYDSYIFPYNKTYYVNGVNELNYNFFLAADRFFTNYWWNIKSLQENIKGVGMLGVQKKLYVGYDVWGRGSTIGKGGFDTSLACQLISKYKSNVALFSPAWTYEQLGHRNFVQNDTRFWVGQFEGEFSVSSSIKPHCSPVFKINDSSFTFYTNFGNGQGQNFNCKGVRVYNYPWVDGNLQWYLPLAINRDQTLGLQMHLDTKESFHGGSCLQVSYVPYLEEKSQGSAGYRVFSEQQVRSLLLFDLEKECYFNTIGVKLSYKLPENPEEVFKLSIKYRVQKKASKATLVSKTGYLVVPLCSTGGSWFTLDNAFSVDTEIQETIVLESIEVGYNNDNMGRSSDTSSLFRSYIVEDSVVTSVIDNEQYEKVVDQDIYHDDEKEGWVVIPRPNSISDSTMSGSTMPENSLPVLKVGEIAIINASNYPSSNFFELTPVTKVRRMTTDEDGILFTWDRSKNNYVLYYVIYINDRFRGTSQTPQFFARKEDIAVVDSADTLFEKATNRSVRATNLGGDGFSLNIAKIRVDIIDKLGTVFPGSELYI